MADEKDPTVQDEPTIYDAVAEAVQEVTPEPAKGPDEETGSEEAGDEETGDEGADADDGADGDGTDGKAKGEEGKDDGDDDEGAESGEGKGEGKGKEGAEGQEGAEKSGDPVNDPIPEGLKDATRERMTALVGRVKELAPIAQERDELLQAIERTGATPEQYAQTLQFLALYNSDKPEHRKQVLGVVKNMLNELAVELNEDVSLDPLASYPDLQAEVEEKTLTEERAREIARGRERDRINNERRTASEQQRNQQNATREAVEGGKKSLNTLEQQLVQRDGEANYKAKKAVVVPLLKTVMRQVHPSQWAKTFLEVYEQTPAPRAATPSTPSGQQPARGQQQQPMRARQPAGESQKAPTTAEEAMKQALGMG